MPRMSCFCVALGLVTVGPLLAQEGAKDVPPAIEDNSFFIEEAYNQEAGIIQHISTFLHFRTPASQSDYSFTQEWPVTGQRHQFSYSIPYAWPEGAAAGFGDVLLNYRYQLLGPDSWAAFAPRLSVILPTGDGGRGGVQVNLPVSKRLGASAVLHANAGATLVHDVKADVGDMRRDLNAYNIGASVIGLVTPTFNLMLEATATFSDEWEGGSVRRQREVIVSPGLRKAFDIGSLQIVPGVAVPISFGEEKTHVGGFVYLSFEHPLK